MNPAMAFARVVTFDGNGRGQRRFDILYAAMLLGAPKGTRGLDTIRREARVLDALDAISTPVDVAAAPGPIPQRHVTPDATLVLAQPEFELLARYLEAVEWAPFASRDVVDAADWLSAAPRGDA
jgi:hypothetical protein